ncbi:MAG TPA: peroxiredoxin [Caulobacteraceae bacterium]|nr:peroxiredoxin [Caulobacteraceae bacterium]
MKRLILAAAAATLLIAGPALAALKPGDKAPEFKANGFLAGQPYSFDLDAALKKGPVVLYFFPAVHTSGCNLEAHLFADAIDQFKRQGATVVGITAGKLSELQTFSNETQYCSGKFPVTADPDRAIARRYDSLLNMPGFNVSNRTSYVIAPDHSILYAYSDLAADHHVTNTLDAVAKWRAAHPH